MIKNQIIKLKTADNFPLVTEIRFNESGNELKPLIIFSHGFKGFKDWGGFPYAMSKFAELGFAAVSFNFSHNGTSEEDAENFSRLDLFAENTFSRELDELGLVINYFYDNHERYNIDRNKIYLLGHSRGGGISILKASEDNRIKKLVTLASVSDFNRYSESHRKKWKEAGYFEVENLRTKQIMRLNYTLLEDLEKNSERLDIRKAVSNLKIPFLIIHGREDISVPYSEALEIYENSDKHLTELFPITNTGHTLGTVHSFKGTTEAFEKVIKKTSEFLLKDK